MRNIKKILRKIYDHLHIFFPFLGAIYYRFPSRKIFVVGVTGTDGKSSTVLMIAACLKGAGNKVGYFSSISYSNGGEEIRNQFKMTTPGRFYLQKFLRELVRNKYTHAILEITSEGIKQHRHRFINFDLVILTNITPEHTESHGGFERYQNAKLNLFKRPFLNKNHKKAILNLDGYPPDNFLNSIHLPVSTCSFTDPTASYFGKIIENDLFKTKLYVKNKTEETYIYLKLGGPFAGKNALLAIVAAALAGVPLNSSARAIENITLIPGRFEIISKSPLVIVDYGHTTAALGELLPYVRRHSPGRLIHVFGAAGGGRDHWKRPLLAGLSEKYCDISIITEENPFDENPEKISEDITKNFSRSHKFFVVPKREDAVRMGFDLADKNDALLLTAKGSETVIAGPQKSKRPYNEREYAKWLASKYSPKS